MLTTGKLAKSFSLSFLRFFFPNSLLLTCTCQLYWVRMPCVKLEYLEVFSGCSLSYTMHSIDMLICFECCSGA